MRRPSDIEERAVKRGADELMNLAEYHFAKQPRTLLRLRREYVSFCKRVYRALERRFHSDAP
jgi:hypothetical protein